MGIVRRGTAQPGSGLRIVRRRHWGSGFVNLPEPEDSVTAGEPFGDVESVKAVSDVYSPVTGIVEEINEELLDSPELINSEANEAWLVKVRDITDQGGTDGRSRV